jgi:TolB-like protein/Tfp pilus assembly protein PilF
MYAASTFVILQLADVTFPVFEVPDWSYRLVIWLLALGFPLALVLAWIFDITPDGIVRTSDLDPGELGRLRRGRKFYLVAIGLLILALGLSLIDRERSGGQPMTAQADIRSIAVLPFANMSSDPDNAYFADGMAEEILNMLAKIPDLRVSARTASFRYRDADKDPRVIGEELGVANILEGSVRRDDKLIRVTVQLISSATGYHLWSETYEAAPTDLFSIQDRIAANVAQALRSTLYVETLRTAASGRTSNLDAYEYYLRARQSGAGDWSRTVQLAEQALALDPDFVNAWALLGEAYSTRIGGTIPAGEAFAKVREAVDAAMAIDPDVPEVLLLRARLERAAHNYAAAEAAYNRAKALAPNRDTSDLANLLVALGRVDEALVEYRHSMRIDPVNNSYRYVYGLVAAGRIDEAVAEAENLMALQSLITDQHRFYGDMGVVYTLAGQHDKALALLDRAESIMSYQSTFLRGRMAYAYARGGETAKAQAIIDDFDRSATTGYVSPSGYFWAYLGLGNIDKTFEWLNRAVEQNSFLIIMGLKTDPAYQPLRADPRFDDVLARAGLDS